MKRCHNCNIEKDALEFYKYKTRGYTYLRAYCKSCWGLRNRARLEKSKAIHKDEIKARQALNNSLRHHGLRSKICESCNNIVNTEAHHFDYNRYFDVLWVCRKCHEWLHHSTVGAAL